MIVGLTGGIGSGKTTVAKLFYKLGVPIYVSDSEAKKLMVTHAKLIAKIKKLLGDNAYVNNTLNRSYISNLVFNNKKLLAQLNAIVHPVVAQDFLKWYAQQNSPYVIKESAILFESGGHKHCDVVITVTAPLQERINRVVLRDGVSEKQVQNRIKNQLSDAEKIKQSDFVIENLNLKTTQKVVSNLHQQLLEKARKNKLTQNEEE